MDNVKKRPNQPIPTHILHHFRAQAKSGKTFRAYSISAGISPLTFYSWRKKYGKHFNAEVKKEPYGSLPSSQDAFTTFSGHLMYGNGDPLLDIHFNDSLRIRLYRGATAEWFAPFYKLLSGGNEVC